MWHAIMDDLLAKGMSNTQNVSYHLKTQYVCLQYILIIVIIYSINSCRHFYLVVQLVGCQPSYIVIVFAHFCKKVQKLNAFQMPGFLSMCKLIVAFLASVFAKSFLVTFGDTSAACIAYVCRNVLISLMHNSTPLADRYIFFISFRH